MSVLYFIHYNLKYFNKDIDKYSNIQTSLCKILQAKFASYAYKFNGNNDVLYCSFLEELDIFVIIYFCMQTA